MEIQNYIINDVEAFDVSSKLKDVQAVFNQLTYSHIPVKKDGHYIGSISETDAYCFESNKLLSDYQYAIEPFHVLEDTNWLDILEAFALYGSNIMPVLGTENKYLGYYELGDIMSLFNNTPFLNETGGIIVVEKGVQDYSFSEICQIVESNGTRIFGAFISKIVNDTVQVTIKVGHSGINTIVQTFRRYNYVIVSQHEEDKFLEDLKERSNYLDKYLNI
ncbi:CBS domain-containing protein [Aequorivita echinoideorum]|uniref:Acetoin utilization protein acuB n=1 Tax=Aequorivita echinoideorum TaxID=1549647 RepID=A0ABS5S5I8_9FLAO|nr:acetoin utilization protein acuB [Aequorivita echinoideorum]MBT0607680.1 acetoin utilization protein acuB [Aequorivita echinoideorum]